MSTASIDRPKSPATARAPKSAATPCDEQPERYYFEGGLRRVHPYHYTYNTYCKERWRNRELIDIFTSEFRDREPGYYRKALESGYVKVNGQPATPNTILKNGQIISHTLHRHEPPVTGNPVGIIHETEDLLVIDKPAGVPVHSTGRYHYNSVMEILRIDYAGKFNPRPCNRLDRLTSGVMFFGKTTQGANQMTVKLKERGVQKEYVARVKGKFPDGVVVVDQPIMSVSPKVGLNRVRATGKEAKTKFRRLAYYPPPQAGQANGVGQGEGKEGEDGRAATPPPSYVNESEGYSIVHCLPLTGRTHQIRVHLQFLGHPISNDPIYSNRRVFGPDLGKNDASGDLDEEIIERLMVIGRTEASDSGLYTENDPSKNKTAAASKPESESTSESPSTPASTAPTPTPNPSTSDSKDEKDKDKDQTSYRTHFTTPPVVPAGTSPQIVKAIMTKEHTAAVEGYQKRKGERLSGETCNVCGTALYTDPGVHELGIFLHALAYADEEGEWAYRSKMPTWALPRKGLDGPREVPEWVVGGEGSEIVVGSGVVPELGSESEGEGKGRDRNKKDGGAGVQALVEGVGVVDISGAAQEREREAASAAGST